MHKPSTIYAYFTIASSLLRSMPKVCMYSTGDIIHMVWYSYGIVVLYKTILMVVVHMVVVPGVIFPGMISIRVLFSGDGFLVLTNYLICIRSQIGTCFLRCKPSMLNVLDLNKKNETKRDIWE